MTHSRRMPLGGTVTGDLATRRLRVTTAALLVLGTGCGLISSDIAKVSFDLPARSYRFDTQQAGWNTAATSMFTGVPAIACASDADCCPTEITLLFPECATSIVCDTVTTGTCAYKVTVEAPPATIDLKMEVPSISSISNQGLIDIAVSQLTYDVTENSLNVDLPPIELFIADQAAASAPHPTDDPSATKFGTVPVIAKGKTLTGGKVTLEATAEAAFNKIGHHLGTPFVFLSRAAVLVPGGTPVPSGALSITVHGRLSAKPSL